MNKAVETLIAFSREITNFPPTVMLLRMRYRNEIVTMHEDADSIRVYMDDYRMVIRGEEREVFYKGVCVADSDKLFAWEMLMVEREQKPSRPEYDICNHGLQHSDYFQGVCSGKYDNVVVGIGVSEREALDDAIDQIASGYDNLMLVETLEKEIESASDKDEVACMNEYCEDEESEDMEHPWVHVSVRW